MKGQCEIAVSNEGGWLRWRRCRNHARIRCRLQKAFGLRHEEIIGVCPLHMRRFGVHRGAGAMIPVYQHGEGDPPSVGGYMRMSIVEDVLPS